MSETSPQTSEQPAQKWEYFVTPLILHNEGAILNKHAQQGWELVQVVEGPAGGPVAYLKREV
jgi:hypothetical protein